MDTGLKREKSADLLRSAGDFDSCSAGTAEGPSANCASPIQVFLSAIPGRVEEEGPPGTVKVDFVSANPASRWDVYADDKVICTTPCEQWVSAERPLMLRAREEAFMAAPDHVQVANLLGHEGEGRVQLQAHPTARGQLAGGIVATAFSGMAVITGITLSSAGVPGGRWPRLLHGGAHYPRRRASRPRGQHLAHHRLDAESGRGAVRWRRHADGRRSAFEAPHHLGADLRERHLLAPVRGEAPLLELQAAIRAGAALERRRRATPRAGRVTGCGQGERGVVRRHRALAHRHLAPPLLNELRDPRGVLGTRQELQLRRAPAAALATAGVLTSEQHRDVGLQAHLPELFHVAQGPLEAGHQLDIGQLPLGVFGVHRLTMIPRAG